MIYISHRQEAGGKCTISLSAIVQSSNDCVSHLGHHYDPARTINHVLQYEVVELYRLSWVERPCYRLM